MPIDSQIDVPFRRGEQLAQARARRPLAAEGSGDVPDPDQADRQPSRSKSGRSQVVSEDVSTVRIPGATMQDPSVEDGLR